MSAHLAIETMRKKHGYYEEQVLDALLSIKEAEKNKKNIREIPAKAVQVGMVFAEDVKMHNGVLLVGRGYEVTAGFIERIAQYKPGMIREPVRIFEQTK
jgi:hypothetical protein